MIHNAITFPKIDAREGGQPRCYLFDDWLLVMPIDYTSGSFSSAIAAAVARWAAREEWRP
jgi:hypothetical protein